MTTKTTATQTTRTIAGRAITLSPGLRYHASRPMAARGRTAYPVAIRSLTGDGLGLWGRPVATIPGLSYDEANAFLTAFNAGQPYRGRLWK